MAPPPRLNSAAQSELSRSAFRAIPMATSNLRAVFSAFAALLSSWPLPRSSSTSATEFTGPEPPLAIAPVIPHSPNTGVVMGGPPLVAHHDE